MLYINKIWDYISIEIYYYYMWFTLKRAHWFTSRSCVHLTSTDYQTRVRWLGQPRCLAFHAYENNKTMKYITLQTESVLTWCEYYAWRILYSGMNVIVEKKYPGNQRLVGHNTITRTVEFCSRIVSTDLLEE